MRGHETYGVLEPDLDDAVESLTLDIGGKDHWGGSGGSGSDSGGRWLEGGLSRAGDRGGGGGEDGIGAGEGEGSGEEHLESETRESSTEGG